MEREKANRKASVDANTILALKEELEALHAHNDEVEARLHDSSEQLALHEKLVAQHGILKHVFYGVIGLIMMMGLLVFWGWHTEQTTIEREMAFFERILLVLIGIVGGAVSSFFDIRNFTVSGHRNGGNGNGKKKNVGDYE